jgi:hypothetical protein
MALCNSKFSSGTITAFLYKQEENTIKSDRVKRCGDHIVINRSSAGSYSGVL